MSNPIQGVTPTHMLNVALAGQGSADLTPGKAVQNLPSGASVPNSASGSTSVQHSTPGTSAQHSASGTPAQHPAPATLVDSADIARAEALLETISTAAEGVPKVDQLRVAELQNAIASGTYQVNSQQLALKIYELEQVLAFEGR
jgi:flagellar biosynthesis anti-sigma factor FlgM